MSRDGLVFFVKVGAPGASQVRVDQSERIEAIKYDDEETKTDKAIITVDNFDLKLTDSPLWREDNIIELAWGWPGRISPTREAIIVQNEGGRKLKITAHDKGSILHTKHKVRHWDNMKRSDVVKAIALEQGYDADAQVIWDTKVVLPHIIQARLTDAQLLNVLAKRMGNWVWFIDFDGFHFHPRFPDQKPLREFIYYIDPGQGDIKDWSIEADKKRHKHGSVTTHHRDPFTKEETKHTADNASTQRVGLAPIITMVGVADGEKHDEPMTKNLATEHVSRSTEHSAEAAKAHADDTYRAHQLDALRLKVIAIGDPFIVAKSVVKISGIGPSLSGNYYVRKVEHDMTAGKAYEMTMHLKRDGRNKVGTGLPGQGTGVPSSASQNNKDKGGGLTAFTAVDSASGAKSEGWRDTKGREIPKDGGK